MAAGSAWRPQWAEPCLKVQARPFGLKNRPRALLAAFPAACFPCGFLLVQGHGIAFSSFLVWESLAADVALFGAVIGSGPGAGSGTCVSGAAPALPASGAGPELPLRVGDACRTGSSRSEPWSSSLPGPAAGRGALLSVCPLPGSRVPSRCLLSRWVGQMPNWRGRGDR